MLPDTVPQVLCVPEAQKLLLPVGDPVWDMLLHWEREGEKLELWVPVPEPLPEALPGRLGASRVALGLWVPELVRLPLSVGDLD